MTDSGYRIFGFFMLTKLRLDLSISIDRRKIQDFLGARIDF